MIEALATASAPSDVSEMTGVSETTSASGTSDEGETGTAPAVSGLEPSPTNPSGEPGSLVADLTSSELPASDRPAGETGGAPEATVGSTAGGSTPGDAQIPTTGSVTPAEGDGAAATPAGRATGGGAAFAVPETQLGLGASGADSGAGLRGTTGGAAGGASGQAFGATITGPIQLEEAAPSEAPARQTIPAPTVAPPPEPYLQVLPQGVEENHKGATAATVTIAHKGKQTFTIEVDDDRFIVVDGIVALRQDVALDHETEPTVEVTVTATAKDGTVLVQTVTIAVGDVNEAPTAVALSSSTVVGASGGAVVGTLSTTDVDAGDSHSYVVNDNRFEIVDGNQLKLKDWAALDPLVEGTVELSVTATDSGGLTRIEDLTITVAPDSEETLVNTTTEGAQFTSFLAQLPGGTPVATLAGGGWVITWMSQVEDGFGIFAQLYAADGSALGDEFRADAAADGFHILSNVAALADGGFVVTWTTGLNEVGAGITVQRFAADGSPLGDALAIDGGDAGQSVFSTIAGLADGGFVVTWTRGFIGLGSGETDENHDIAVFGQRYDVSGDAVGDEFRISADASVGLLPSVAALKDGGFVVTWTTGWLDDQDHNDLAPAVFGQRFAADGSALDHIFRISGDDAALLPSVAALADGGFVVTWTTMLSDEDNGVFGQRYDANGMTVDEAFRINPGGEQQAFFPAVAALADGGFVVSWITGDSDGPGIAGQRYDAAGELAGKAFLINVTTAGAQFSPAVAGLPDGGFVVTWDGNGEGDQMGVFSRVFGAAGEAQVGTSDGDLLVGSAHDDVLYGMAGNDILDGRAGDNVLWGGPGADTFRISSLGGTSSIMDFSAQEGDVILLHGILTGVTELDGVTLAAYLRLTVEEGTTTIAIDADGGGSFAEPDAVIVVSGADLLGGVGQAAAIQALLDAQALQLAVAPAAITLSAATVEENDDGAVIGNLSSHDADSGDTVTYTVAGEQFEVVNGVLKLKHGQSLDFEIEPTVEVEITATDNRDLSVTQSFTITVIDVNEAPTSITLSADIVPNFLPGAVIGTLSTVDPDQNDSHTYSVDDARFEVVGDELRLKPWAALDPETEPTLTIEVTTTDAGDLSHTQTLTLKAAATGEQEILVNTETAGQQVTLGASHGGTTIAALDGGGFVVVWDSAGQDGDGSGVYGQRFDSARDPVGSEFRINSHTGSDQGHGSVAALDGGGFVVTWQSLGQDGSGNGVYGQRYDEDGGIVGQEFRVNTTTTYDQQYASVAALDGGGFVVTWSSLHQDGSGSGIYGRHYDEHGVADGGEFRVNTETTDHQMNASVAALDGGGFVVVWQSMNQDADDGYGVYGKRFDAAGTAIGQEFKVNTYTTSNQANAKVAALDGGGFVVTWSSEGQDGSSTGVYAQRYDADGQVAGEEFRANTYTSYSQQQSSVTAMEGGGFVITWSSAIQDGDGHGIYGQRFAANGDPLGDEFLINVSTTGNQLYSSVAGLPGGDFAVVWSGNGNGDDSGVFLRIFDESVQVGTAGDDTLIAGGSDTLLVGMAGNDILDGGAGDNVLWGGPGADTFRISSLGGTSSIMDFSAAEGDVLEFHHVLTGLFQLDGQSLAGYLEVALVDGGTVFRVDASGGAAFEEPDAVVVLANVDLVQGAVDQLALLGSLVQSGLLQASLDAPG